MKQRDALTHLKEGENIFLTGAAGTGKTFVLEKFIRWARTHDKEVAVTASSGVAATHLSGTTVHSWSGIMLKDSLTESDIKKMMRKPYLREHIISTDVLIIDEISMLHAYQLDLINKVCKQFRRDIRPFGGMQVILSGDFFQLPPVKQGRKGSGFPDFAIHSRAWAELGLRVCYLTEHYRHQDLKYLTLLNRIRQERCGPADIAALNGRRDVQLSSHIKPVKIFTHTMDVDTLNASELATLRHRARRYTMRSSGAEPLVQQLQKNCLAPAELLLKQDAVVMFVKNNFDLGYVNGTMGIVTDFDDDGFPIVETVHGDTVAVRPASWTIEEQDGVVAEIEQLPLRLAWAITVHKSQGMSIDLAEIDLGKTFEYGMGYVALSRVRSFDGLRLRAFNTMALGVDPAVVALDTQLQKAGQ